MDLLPWIVSVAARRDMKNIAHRGSMAKGMQNSPEGVRLAVSRGADSVELDVVRGKDGRFYCGHGMGRRSLLGDCLVEMGKGVGLIAHLKGRYADDELMVLVDEIGQHVEMEHVWFASHRGEVLERLRKMFPEARLARFGFSRRWRPCGSCLRGIAAW